MLIWVVCLVRLQAYRTDHRHRDQAADRLTKCSLAKRLAAVHSQGSIQLLWSSLQVSCSTDSACSDTS